MAPEKLVFRVHAIKRMAKRGISEANVRHVLATGEAIETYPQDKPYPSRLVLGWCHGRPLHIVAAHNDRDGETIIIAAYEPSPMRWGPGFGRRKQS